MRFLKKSIIKIAICILLTIVVGTSTPLLLTAATISELKSQMAETQKQLSALNGQAKGVQNELDDVDAEIAALDGRIVEMMASIALIEEEIEQKKEEIIIASDDLEIAKAEERSQYEAMKKRIKFMYEKGNRTYAQLLLESKGFSDMMNKAEYIEKLYAYDRKMLEEYEKARQMVEELKEALEEEEAELEAEEFELSLEKEDLEVALEEKKAEAENFEVQIAKIKQDAAQYQALIKQQTAQIKQLEAEEAARRAAEEARRKAEEAKKNGGSSSSKNTGKNVTADVASIIANASGSSKGKEIASFACRFIGNPYVAGGTSLTDGADCSGFTQAVYKNFGYSIPRNSSSQREYGKSVSYDEAQPGDIICYSGHVALYIGNGKIVHASTQKTGIKIGDVNYKPILSIRRIV